MVFLVYMQKVLQYCRTAVPLQHTRDIRCALRQVTAPLGQYQVTI